MTLDTNAYLARQYGPQPCWELVADLYTRELQALPVDYTAATRSVRQMARAFRIALHNSAHGVIQVAEPVDLCSVLLAKNAHIGIHHCGVYYGGSVLHALPNHTMYEPLSVIRDSFETVQFWAKT